MRFIALCLAGGYGQFVCNDELPRGMKNVFIDISTSLRNGAEMSSLTTAPYSENSSYCNKKCCSDKLCDVAVTEHNSNGNTVCMNFKCDDPQTGEFACTFQEAVPDYDQPYQTDVYFTWLNPNGRRYQELMRARKLSVNRNTENITAVEKSSKTSQQKTAEEMALAEQVATFTKNNVEKQTQSVVKQFVAPLLIVIVVFAGLLSVLFIRYRNLKQIVRYEKLKQHDIYSRVDSYDNLTAEEEAQRLINANFNNYQRKN